MKKVNLIITDVQVRPDFSGVVITKQSNDNPSKTGVFQFTAGGMQRLAARAGLGNPLAMKHVVSLGASLQMDVKECKQGDAWENEKTGESGIYEKDFFQTNNEEIKLSSVAAAKVAEIALQSVFANPLAVATPAPVAQATSTDPESEEEEEKEEE